MSRSAIREAFRETVANRVSYYGEYLVERDGEWVMDEVYLDDGPPAVTPASDD